jgi:DNA-binding NarL/FixJ family response regulator
MNEWHHDVLIFDNCPLFMSAVRTAFETTDAASISIADSIEQAIESIRAETIATPRLLIIGPHIDTSVGFAACREAAKRKVAIIFINSNIDDHIFIADAAIMGVNRRLPITITAQDLLITASEVLSDAHSDVEAAAFGDMQLSPRELEVIRLWADGKTDKEVAAILCIGHTTARNHAARILTKLNVHSRNDAIHRARHHGLI